MHFLKRTLRNVNHLFQHIVVVSIQTIGKFIYSCRRERQWPEIATSRILVIRLDEIGDMVMMSSFLQELRRGYPKAHVLVIVIYISFRNIP